MEESKLSENLRKLVRKAVERADLEALKDRVAGFPRSLIEVLAKSYHDLDNNSK